MSAGVFTAIHFQPRDLAVLRGLFECRVMSAEHIAEIHFSGRREYAKKRLQAYKAAGLVVERPRKSTEPAALTLTARGMGVLREHGILAEYPAASLPVLQKRASVSDLTIRHELEVMAVKAAFYRSLRTHSEFSVAEFTTWPRLIEFTAARPDGTEVLVKPDGFIRIHEKETDGGLFEHTFFLEVDRSTETLDTLVSRAICYLNHYKSGGFAERCGGVRSNFKDYPFRVLIVLKSDERRNNLAERLLHSNPPIFTQVWLSTMSEVASAPLDACWLRPTDYRDALQQAGLTSGASRPTFAYQRQSSRDAQIAAVVSRHRIIETTKK